MPKVLATLELHLEGNVASVYCDELWLEESGADRSEIDFVSNMVLNIAIVQVSVYLRKVDSNIRVSLRGKGKVDLSKIAHHFNSGGHKNAAGFSIESTNIEQAKRQILSYLKNYIFD